MERVIKNSLLCVAFLFLAGCATATVGSIAGGECALPGVHTPQYKVLGKTRYDQNWTDDTTEGLVRGCRQARPLARPASLDKQIFRPKQKPVAKATPKATNVSLPVTKKKHFWSRPTPIPPAKPVAVTPATPPVVQPIYPPVLQTTPAPELVPVPKHHWWER